MVMHDGALQSTLSMASDSLTGCGHMQFGFPPHESIGRGGRKAPVALMQEAQAEALN